MNINLYNIKNEIIYQEEFETFDKFQFMKFYNNGIQSTHINPMFVDIQKTITEINKISNKSIKFNTQSVMVIDDEAMLRDLFLEHISRLNHFCEVFSDSVSALEAFNKFPSRYNYILTDNMIDEKDSGSKLAKQVKQTNPKVKVFIISGDLSSIDEDVFDYQIDGAISKPISAFTLSTTIGSGKIKNIENKTDTDITDIKEKFVA